jgi:chromosome segregation ATPase
MDKRIGEPEIPDTEQQKILGLEQRLRVATQRVQDLEDDTKRQAEELVVARTQSRIAIDQEVVNLQQKIEVLEEHKGQLLRELAASETKIKDLESTERDLKKRLTHFRTIYSLKSAYIG